MNIGRGVPSLLNVHRSQSTGSDGPPRPAFVGATAFAPGGVPQGTVALEAGPDNGRVCLLVERTGETVRVRAGSRAEAGLDDTRAPVRVEAEGVLGIANVGGDAFFLLLAGLSDEVIGTRHGVFPAGSVRALRRVVFQPLDGQAAAVLDSANAGAKASSQNAPATLDGITASAKILAQLRADLEEDRHTFYGLGVDPSLSLLRQVQARDGAHAAKADDGFVWNANLLEPFSRAGFAGAWLLPAVRGYVGCSEVKLFGGLLPAAVAVISRRSRHMAGTRYHRRGANAEGHVANEVETEQLVAIGGGAMPGVAWRASIVQLRGSVPLVWMQQGMQYKPRPQISGSESQNSAVFGRHLQRLLAAYGAPLHYVSLLQRGQGDEAELARAFESLSAASAAQVDMHAIDFHRLVKGGQLAPILAYLRPSGGGASLAAQWTTDGAAGMQRSQQAGVVRTSCLDCLDRTNVLQWCVAREALHRQLGEARSLLPVHKAAESWEAGVAKIGEAVQALWSDNGHALSLQYAGTASLRSGLMRRAGSGPAGDSDPNGPAEVEGQSTSSGPGGGAGGRLSAAAGALSSKLTDGAHSIQRYYVSNFKDDVRQQAIDVVCRPLVGYEKRQDVSTTVPVPDFVHVLVMTWNVNGKAPKEGSEESVVAWARAAHKDGPAPDVVVIGMQVSHDPRFCGGWGRWRRARTQGRALTTPCARRRGAGAYRP